jgi:K+-transporting ATPase ATPase B chain
MRDAVFIPTFGTEEELARAAYLASLADLSPDGQLIAELALERAGSVDLPVAARLVPKAGEMSGVDLSDRMLRIGSLDSIEAWLHDARGYLDGRLRKIVSQILARGGLAFVVADESSDLGVIALQPVA